ncbi:MAG: ribosome silencing factor [Candidatus Omnitrophica bacterium]|nr:ribosome silencing factor [Candidatus Omnitrophota bacterium]
MANLARDKKAQQVVVLDMRAVANFCDYFVVLSAQSQRQIQSFAEILQEELGTQGINSLTKTLPHDESGWVVLDFSSVVVHIFNKAMREFYSLERLWSDAKKVRISRRTKKT